MFKIYDSTAVGSNDDKDEMDYLSDMECHQQQNSNCPSLLLNAIVVFEYVIVIFKHAIVQLKYEIRNGMLIL